jgi:metal transporter CNNM
MLDDYFIVAGLVILSGLFSGLTLGMFSLNISDLETKIELGDKDAKSIYSVRKNSFLLLCTLLLGNTAVNSTLSIFLGSIASGVVAGFVATGLIVVIGEILPQAAFNKHAMKFCARLVWFVKFFQIVFYPITKPLSVGLNALLGDEDHAVLSKREIGEIVKKQEDTPESPIDEDEERIILGALSFSDKLASDIATPATVCYYLNQDTEINQTLLEELRTKGFSRIPIYNDTPDNMVGLLYVKDLITIIGDEKEYTAKEIVRTTKLFKIDESTKLDVLFNELIKRKIHLALLYDEFGCFAGIVTLEDIIEEILSVEIVDEQDQVEDMQEFALKKSQSRNIQQNG